MVRAHRSFSQLKTWTRCGELYRLRYVEELSTWKPAAWTALGNGFHTAYESWETEDREGSLVKRFTVEYDAEISRLKTQFPDLRRQWNKPPRTATVERDISLRRDNGIAQAEAYEEHCREAAWELVKTEWSSTLDLNGIEIKLGVDVILKWPSGNYTIRDIKTGNREVDNRQLGLYKVVVEEQLGYPIKFGEYWYTKDGANRSVDLAKYTRETLERDFGRLDFAVKNDIFLANPGDQCMMCEVKPYCREMGNR